MDRKRFFSGLEFGQQERPNIIHTTLSHESLLALHIAPSFVATSLRPYIIEPSLVLVGRCEKRLWVD